MEIEEEKIFVGKQNAWSEFVGKYSPHQLNRGGVPVWQWKDNGPAEDMVVRQQMQAVINAMFNINSAGATCTVDNKRTAALWVKDNVMMRLNGKFRISQTFQIINSVWLSNRKEDGFYADTLEEALDIVWETIGTRTRDTLCGGRSTNINLPPSQSTRQRVWSDQVFGDPTAISRTDALGRIRTCAPARVDCLLQV